MTEAQQIQKLKKFSTSLSKKLQKAFKDMQEEVSGHMHTLLPPEEKPLARILHTTLTEKDVSLDNLRAAIAGRPDRSCKPGTYVVLHTRDTPEENWQIMMSDTPYEMLAARSFKFHAHGDVLIAGLGLGATTLPVLMKPEVKTVTIIEGNGDVLDLVGPKLRSTPWGNKLFIHLDNAYDWKPPKGRKYQTIWLDIWADICTDNLPGITKLKRRYSRWLDRTDERAWMGVWEEAHLRRESRRYGRL